MLSSVIQVCFVYKTYLYNTGQYLLFCKNVKS